MTKSEGDTVITILNTQQVCITMITEVQVQLNALTSALISLDSRAAVLYSEHFEIERGKQAASLEQALRQIELLRAGVSKMVN